MPGLGWLDVTQLDFNALLLLEPFQIEYLATRTPDEEMGTALQAHPAVQWYFQKIYSPAADYVNACLLLVKTNPNPREVREAEVAVMDRMQDWLVYAFDPDIYDKLEFMGWEDESLLGMADFKSKIVLDIGSGTGRLAFTVAPLAEVVYAVEPVANLRRHMWKRRQELGMDNVFPVDGIITRIPFPDGFADIVMAGHVFGDAGEAEYAELRRVTRDGGMILLHPGTNTSSENPTHQFLVENSFEWDTFEEPGDGLKRKYWKTINKNPN
jgi:SAM-dependent methyltransferase